MYSFLLNKDIREENLLPCYFLYGEELFLAQHFLSELKESLISPDEQDYPVEKFDLDSQSWTDIVDTARTYPFFLKSWRLIHVEAPPGKSEKLSAVEEDVVREFLASPVPRTLLVIVYKGPLKKNTPLYRLFSSLSPGAVFIKELKSLKGRRLMDWVEKKLRSEGKIITPEAEKRLLEFSGNNLSRLDNEIRKLVTFIDEKKTVELDDINQVSGWVKSFYEWEISDNLEKGDLDQCLIVLGTLFKEGTKPEYVLGMIAGFFRNIAAAQLMLKEKEKDRKTIFKEIKPRIKEQFGSFYLKKFRSFFQAVEGISEKDLNRFFKELERIDLKIKTSDLSPQTLMEGFILDYCRKREQKTSL